MVTRRVLAAPVVCAAAAEGRVAVSKEKKRAPSERCVQKTAQSLKAQEEQKELEAEATGITLRSLGGLVQSN